MPMHCLLRASQSPAWGSLTGDLSSLLACGVRVSSSFLLPFWVSAPGLAGGPRPLEPTLSGMWQTVPPGSSEVASVHPYKLSDLRHFRPLNTGRGLARFFPCRSVLWKTNLLFQWTRGQWRVIPAVSSHSYRQAYFAKQGQRFLQPGSSIPVISASRFHWT